MSKGEDQLARAEAELSRQLSDEQMTAYRTRHAKFRRSSSKSEWQAFLASLASEGWQPYFEAQGGNPDRVSPGPTVLQSVGSIGGGLWRWAIGIAVAVGIFGVVTFFQSNEVQDHLNQLGFEVASVEVATRIHQINVEVNTTDGAYAQRVCEALRGAYATDDGKELIPVVFYDPPGNSYSGSSTRPCQR